VGPETEKAHLGEFIVGLGNGEDVDAVGRGVLTVG